MAVKIIGPEREMIAMAFENAESDNTDARFRRRLLKLRRRQLFPIHTVTSSIKLSFLVLSTMPKVSIFLFALINIEVNKMPAAQIMKSGPRPNFSITAPPINEANGVSPSEPIVSKLWTFANLSLSTDF